VVSNPIELVTPDSRAERHSTEIIKKYLLGWTCNYSLLRKGIKNNRKVLTQKIAEKVGTEKAVPWLFPQRFI
jgi:hypothetical protein